ncbi:Acetyltransferase (GNAT) domain-containing protein [Klenkia soli]|uniref:Acetyltransferase (GNAT) domain-containing protein n=1 Tax=Klenkia soli TaxID=1052260 RepID=A0A1H0R154_9ACTN|nr:GNAT family N-acetyltransferase [Klenkia soli]SDP23140.1 Acetyltransferase (GNAT) domain-containing protein [Klenkia soli]
MAATFLLAWVGTDLVGRTSVRHELDERLLRVGGHIGYGVLPDRRGRGYAAEMLRQGLVVARSEGVIAVLVDCDEGNAASARTIERWGGVLDTVVENPDGGPAKRRYWIR